MKPLEKIFWDEVAEMLHLEGMLAKSVPKMQTAVENEPLKELFTTYRTIVDANLAKLSEMLQLFELPVREKKNDCAMALLTKVQQTSQRIGQGPVLDAVLLSLMRKVIASKVSNYTALTAWAKLLSDGHNNPVTIFESFTAGEVQFDAKLKRLAPKCDAAAAEQEIESARKAPPKKPREFELPQRSAW